MKKQNLFKKILSILLCLCMLMQYAPAVVLTASAAAGEVVVSYDFNDGKTGAFDRAWPENGYLFFDATTDNYQKAYSYIDLNSNTTYVVSFSAKADKDTTLRFVINNDWGSENVSESVNVTTEWQNYQLIVNSGDLNRAIVMFASEAVASEAAIYYIDNLVIAEYVPDPEPEPDPEPCEHDVPECQGGTCSKCGDEIQGHGCENLDTPACMDGVCYYCGGFVAGYGHENGAWASCLDGECAYGCGLQYPAAEEHIDDDGDDYCDNCWSHLKHVDNDGDGWCDVCWEEFEPQPCEHTYDDCEDTDCNVCGEARDAIDHVDEDGDNICDNCGAAMESAEPNPEPCEHEYDNDCDTDCNVCGEARDAIDHVDEDGDASCDNCGAAMESAEPNPEPCEHEYDNDCDTDCNDCGEPREVGDHVDNDSDWLCDNCEYNMAPLGHEKNPISLNSACNYVVIPGGDTHYYENTCLDTTTLYATLTVTGSNFAVTANGETHEPENGVVSGIPCLYGSIISIENRSDEEAEFLISYDYLLGSANNPAPAKLGDNEAPVKAGSQGYYLSYIAQKDGNLLITISGEEHWGYTVNNMTMYDYGEMQWSDSDPVINPWMSEVLEGDEIQIVVNGYNPDFPFGSPAADLIVNLAYEGDEPIEPEEPEEPGCEHEYDNACDADCNLCSEERDASHVDEDGDNICDNCYGNVAPSGSAANPIVLSGDSITVEIPGGKTHYFTGLYANCVLSVTGSDFAVFKDGTKYDPVDGVVSVNVENNFRNFNIAIQNNSEEAATFTLEFVVPLGSENNPEQAKLGDNVVFVAADSQGYHLYYIAQKDGKLLITISGDADWSYRVNNITANVYSDAYGSKDDTVINPCEMEVSAGDEIEIVVAGYEMWNDDGEFTVNLAYEGDEPIEPEEPEEPGCEHEYDNDCDVDCDLCGDVREAPHYIVDDYACYRYCCVCSKDLTTADHVYDEGCDDLDCNTCGQVRVSGHTLTYHEAKVPANCQEKGYEEYWTCSVCEKYFGDEVGSWEINPDWMYYTGNHVRPEDAAPCEVVSCTVCGEDDYGSENCDRGDAPACQDATCINCGNFMWGEGHSYGYDESTWESLSPLCQPGNCIYCGEYLQKIYDCQNGSYASCVEDGECLYGCGKQFPATGEHQLDDPCAGGLCWQCWEQIEPVHTYYDACDADCEFCGEEREAPHYPYGDYDCYYYCSRCNKDLSTAEHVYTNECDADCNVCSEEREVGEHVDNDGDILCDNCQMDLTPAVVTHLYVVVDGISYTGGRVQIDSDTESIIFVVTGTNFQNLGEHNLVFYTPLATMGIGKDYSWEVDAARGEASVELIGYLHEYEDCVNHFIEYSNDGGDNWVTSSIYLSWGDVIVDPDEPEPEPVELPEIIYFDDSDGLFEETIFAEFWNADSTENIGYEAMTRFEGDLYYVEVPDGAYLVNITTGSGRPRVILGPIAEGNNLCKSTGVLEDEGQYSGTWSTYVPEEKIIVNMYVRSDSWNGASIKIYKKTGDVIDVQTLTLDDGEETGTEYIDIDPDASYKFLWNQGENDNKCFFTIFVNGVLKARVDYAHQLDDNETILTLGEDFEIESDEAVLESVTITVDGEEYGAGETAIITPDTESLIFTVSGKNFENLSENQLVIFDEENGIQVVSDIWDVDDIENTATYDISNSLEEFAYFTTLIEIMLSNDGGETLINTGVYLQYSEPTEPDEPSDPDDPSESVSGIVIEMIDSYGDSWNENAIEVYKNGELVETATIGNWAFSNTVTLAYDSEASYEFKWKQGYYPDECSFTISIDGEVVLSHGSNGGCSDFVDGFLFLTVDKGVVEVLICDHDHETYGEYSDAYDHRTFCSNCGAWVGFEEHDYENNICTACSTEDAITVRLGVQPVNEEGQALDAWMWYRCDEMYLFSLSGGISLVPGKTYVMDENYIDLGYELKLEALRFTMDADGNFTFGDSRVTCEETEEGIFIQVPVEVKDPDAKVFKLQLMAVDKEYNPLDDFEDIDACLREPDGQQEYIYGDEGIGYRLSVGKTYTITGWDCMPEGYLYPKGDVTFTVDEAGKFTITSNNAAAITEGDVTYIAVPLEAGEPVEVEMGLLVKDTAGNILEDEFVSFHGVGCQIYSDRTETIALLIGEEYKLNAIQMDWDNYQEPAPLEFTVDAEGKVTARGNTVLEVGEDGVYYFVVTLKPKSTIVITQQPTDSETKLGETYRVEVIAEGEGLKYQWYFCNEGSDVYYKSSTRTSVYTGEMNEVRMNRKIYCVITDAWGNSVETEKAQLLVKRDAELKIVTQPTDSEVAYGENYHVEVVAEGDGLKYQWYFCKAGNWYRSSVTGSIYSGEMTKERAGRKVYCIVTDIWGNSVQTPEVELIAIPAEELMILSQNVTLPTAMGEGYNVEIIAQGDGLQYTWYFCNAGSGRYYRSAIMDNTYDDVMNSTRLNRKVYCVITDEWGNSVTTDTFTLSLQK